MKLPKRTQVVGLLTPLAKKAVVLLVIAYIVFSVGRSVMKNYDMNQRIAKLSEQIAELEQEKNYLRNLIAYYKTNTFKELKSREELGLQKPGEHVLSVPVEEEDRPLGAKENILAPAPEEAKPLQNYEKWLQYFFG